MTGTEVKTQAEYEAALAEIERLEELEAPKGSPEHEELQRLSEWVALYELEEARARDPDDLPVEDPEETLVVS